MLLGLIVTLALTISPKDDASCHNVKICKRLHHKTVSKPTIVVPVEKECCGSNQQQQQNQQQQVVVVVGNGAAISSNATIVNVNPAPVALLPEWGVGVLGAVGAWDCGPHVFGLVGLRGRYFPYHLGVGVDTQFYWGNDVKLMLYPIQGPISWHLDLGGLWFYHLPFSTQDITRSWDMLVGTGLEVEVLSHLSITADWRMTTPNPFDLTRLAYPDVQNRSVNPGDVVGNSFLRSQVMLGLMLSTW